MKYYKRLNVYKSSKEDRNVYDPSTEEATSYGWYVYAKKYPKIGWVENSCSYSNTTSKHMSKWRSLMNYPKVKYIYAPKGLTNNEATISWYENQINELLNLISTPGTRKATNIERAKLVLEHRATIAFVKKYMKE